MTEQYLPSNINQGSGGRRVDQSDIDSSLAVPAVVLNPDDEFVLCGDDTVTGVYQVNLPPASECQGVEIVLKNIPAGVAITIASAVDENGNDIDTFDGAAGPMATALAATFSVILRASPPLAPVAPSIIGTQANDWTVVRTPSAAVP